MKWQSSHLNGAMRMKMILNFHFVVTYNSKFRTMGYSYFNQFSILNQLLRPSRWMCVYIQSRVNWLGQIHIKYTVMFLFVPKPKYRFKERNHFWKGNKVRKKKKVNWSTCSQYVVSKIRMYLLWSSLYFRKKKRGIFSIWKMQSEVKFT